MVLLAALLLASCGDAPPAFEAPPLIVVGVDGLEWDLVLKFGAEGALPNLMALAREGYAAKLETLDQGRTLSPMVWTTIATGKEPEQHGILGFWYEEPDQSRHLFSRVHRRSKALWNLLSERERNVDVFGWWCTFPAEEIGGRMVAQTATQGQIDIKSGKTIWKGSYLEGAPFQVTPEEFAPRMDQIASALAATVDTADDPLVAAFGTPRFPEPAPGHVVLTQQLWDAVTVAFYADVEFRDAALATLADSKSATKPGARPLGELLVYFGVTDVASHMFWRHLEPQKFSWPTKQEEEKQFGHVIRDAYRWVDDAIGKLHAAAPDADLLILSDHGFHAANVDTEFRDPAADDPIKRLDSGHHMDAPPGVLIACGKSFKKLPLPLADAKVGATATVTKSMLSSVGRVQDILPTLLAREGIPYGEDMAGRPLRQLLADDLLRARPITSVKTHDDNEWRTAQQKALADYSGFERKFADSLRGADDERIKRLKRLGYTGTKLEAEKK